MKTIKVQCTLPLDAFAQSAVIHLPEGYFYLPRVVGEKKLKENEDHRIRKIIIMPSRSIFLDFRIGGSESLEL